MNSYRIRYTTDNQGATTSVEWGDDHARLGLGDPKAAALKWAAHLATRSYVTSVEVIELTHTTIHEYRR